MEPFFICQKVLTDVCQWGKIKLRWSKVEESGEIGVIADTKLRNISESTNFKILNSWYSKYFVDSNLIR